MSDTTYELPMTLESVRMPPAVAQAHHGDLITELTYHGLRVVIDPSIPPNQLLIIARTEQGAKATIVCNVGDPQP